MSCGVGGGVSQGMTLCPPAKHPRCPHSLRGRVVELVLGGAVEARLHPRVLPQLLDAVDQLGGHRPLLDGVGQVEELPPIVLQEGPFGVTDPIPASQWIWG